MFSPKRVCRRPSDPRFREGPVHRGVGVGISPESETVARSINTERISCSGQLRLTMPQRCSSVQISTWLVPAD